MRKSSRHAFTLAAMALMGLTEAAIAQEYRFMAPPQVDQNRIYRVNRLTGEVSACQYIVKEGTVGATLCFPSGEGAGAQTQPGDYELVPSNHGREGGIFRVNTRTGEVSVCYIAGERVVCTPQTR